VRQAGEQHKQSSNQNAVKLVAIDGDLAELAQRKDSMDALYNESSAQLGALRAEKEQLQASTNELEERLVALQKRSSDCPRPPGAVKRP
jgi:chromosome segregation ATPase